MPFPKCFPVLSQTAWKNQPKIQISIYLATIQMFSGGGDVQDLYQRVVLWHGRSQIPEFLRVDGESIQNGQGSSFPELIFSYKCTTWFSSCSSVPWRRRFSWRSRKETLGRKLWGVEKFSLWKGKDKKQEQWKKQWEIQSWWTNNIFSLLERKPLKMWSPRMENNPFSM